VSMFAREFRVDRGTEALLRPLRFAPADSRCPGDAVKRTRSNPSTSGPVAPERGTSPLLWRFLPPAAAVTAGLLALAVAWRPISSLDLGYHLAYGGVFWSEGRIVDDGTFLVPLPSPNEAHGDLPPGARFDVDGRYTFPNANWLSQVIMSLAYRLGGASGLVLLTLALITTILLAQAAVVRAGTGRWTWVGPVWLATTLTAYERFNLRPELFSSACLVIQLALLARPFTRRRAVLFLGLQLVAVNAHSYWLLGVGLLSAAAIEAVVATIRERPTRSKHAFGRRGRARSAIALLGCALSLAIVHPSGIRNLTLPFETLRYMRVHHIGGSTPEQVQALWQVGQFHPWQDIGELYRSLSAGTMHFVSTRFFIALLLLAAPSAIVLLRRGRIGLALVMVAFALAAVPIRRNMATAGFIVWPLIAVALAEAAGWNSNSSRGRGRLALLAFAATVGAALFWTHGVVTNRFYRSENRETRFGTGFSRAVLPLGVCAWLDENLDRPQPVFTNFNASSSVLFFSRKTVGVPILTNTWAYPPERKSRLMRILSGSEWIDPFAREAGFDMVVLYALPAFRPLISRLASASDWALVYLEGAYVVFARRTPSNEALVAAHSLSPQTLELKSLIAEARALDPQGDWGLRATTGALVALGWDHEARAVLAEWRPNSP
jgi:hypothetical protein